MAKQPSQTKVKKKEKKNISNAIAHVNSSFNNTLITITDYQGNTIAWSSSGSMGFKGSRKSTAYAALLAGEEAGKIASDHVVKILDSLFRSTSQGELSPPEIDNDPSLSTDSSCLSVNLVYSK